MKLVADLRLNFMRDGKPRMWTVLVGPNGVCKTTILRSIAMAAVGHARANQLADVPSLRDLRTKGEGMGVSALFILGDAAKGRVTPPTTAREVFSWVTLDVDESLLGENEKALEGTSILRFKPKEEDDTNHWLAQARAKNSPGIFVAGYGVNRNLPAPSSAQAPKDPIQSQLNSLFGRERIIGTGFSEILSETKKYVAALEEALVEGGLLPKVTLIELRGRNGASTFEDLANSHRFGFGARGAEYRVPSTWLSQGYQSTIAWIADLIGHASLEAGRVLKPAEIEGLVLIDEIDLHLHPQWQVNLIPALKKIFPLVQFIATTHSPMVLPGLEADEVVMLDFDEDGNVVKKEQPGTPQLLTGSQLYREFFGISELYPNDLGEKMNQLGYLVGNAYRSEAEELQMWELIKLFKSKGLDPEWVPVPRVSDEERKP
jgi:hypothetical protein